MISESIQSVDGIQPAWEALGSGISQGIFFLARLLVNDAIPGLVSLAILVVLVISIGVFVELTRRERSALQWLHGRIAQTSDEAEFTFQTPAIDAAVQNVSDKKAYASLATAWQEYRKTLVLDETAGTTVLRNSVRPAAFFNIESLRYGPKFARYAPGLFVAVGLLLTFLGLIAALQAVNIPPGATPDQTRDALSDLLGAASAKFIMSLTGLFSSIVFTIILRVYSARTEGEIHSLCGLLETRLSFISLEDVAMRQLVIARGQEDSFKRIGMEMVERLGEPLRKEVPETIATSIGAAIAPLIDRVGKVGTDGVGQMVEDLSSRFSEDVGRALSEASSQLSAAGEKIASLADRMDRSAGQMGQEMEGSIAKLAGAAEELTSRLSVAAERTDGTLNAGAEKLLSIMSTTLEGIRTNTAEGTVALQQAADTMRDAAGVFREQLDAAADSGAAAFKGRMEAVGAEAQDAISMAGHQVVDQVTRSGSTMLETSGQFAEKLRTDLIAPLDALVSQFNEMTVSLREGSGQIAAAAGNIRVGGEASRHAAESLSSASGNLRAASEPIRASVERIESAVSSLSKSTQAASDTVTRSSREVAEQAARVLGAAYQALEAEQQALQAVLLSLRQLLTKMETQRDQVDTLDDKLGKAFSLYTSTVDTTIRNLHGHVGEMNETLTQGVDTLRQVVDQAEKFIPQSRR
ncbi:MAG: anti-phage defense protein ZorA [Chromatiales bacterium]|nr:anti-phage defense protein ZorA [Chromatiales bacterium]TVS10302.1 MAG: hypothetical protein EA417_19160 [Gammaproteobacteria bacterium]